MKNVWSILCSKAVIDQMSNSLSLHDCIEEFTVSFNNPEDIKKELKQIPVSFDIVSLWHDEDINNERKVSYVSEIIDPRGEKLDGFTVEANFEKGKKRLRTIAQIRGLKMTVEGTYLFKIKLKSEKKIIQVSETPIDIKFVLNIR